MTDSVAVFPPGFRLTDSTTGDPMSGATIEFFDAGTSTPKTVYSDLDLTTELGTSVTCDSLGYPTSNGSTKTMVFVGIASYKIVIKTSSGTTIATHDNLKGAAEVSTAGGSSTVTASFPVVTKSLDYTVLAADQNTGFAVNCSSADVTLTLPSAVTVGSGFAIQVQHAGSANQAILATVSSQTISEGTKSFGTSFSLGLNGEECWIISDGGNWRVFGHTTPFPKVMPIPVIDRVSAAPGTPVQGGYYLVSSAYSTFSVGDIIQYTGSSYVAFTPYTDCGWIAWVADEDLYYHHRGTVWVAESASDTAAGVIEIAVQSEMETATDTGRAVPPGRQQYHPGHPKVWAKVGVSAGTPSISTSYNMTSVTDVGAGSLTVTIATDFSSANWACSLACEESLGAAYTTLINAQAAGTAGFSHRDAGSDGATDPAAWHFAGLGDQ